MKKTFVCAACDFGASSGRVIKGIFDGGALSVIEAHRFANAPVREESGLYWDIGQLYNNMRIGLELCAGQGIKSIGIDAWGVDFGLLGNEGKLISQPMSYRDVKNEKAMERVLAVVGDDEMYRETGIANMSLNTVYQLYRLKTENKLDENQTLLMLPDLLSYFLTGKISNEITAVSSTQLMKGRSWNWELIQALQLPEEIFSAPLAQTGACKGLANSVNSSGKIKVIAVPGHDTACAVNALPELGTDSVFISSGTWSLLGVRTNKPFISKEGMYEGYSNYLGTGGYICLKDIMGMWLLNRCRESWKMEGNDYGFDEIVCRARKANKFRAWIDPDEKIFFDARNMPEAIAENCFGISPETPGDIARCIFESLALKYRYSLEKLEKIANKKFAEIRMVGGGIQNSFLCQCVANAAARPCICGPVEATAVGNIVAQLISAGELANMNEAEKMMKISFPVREYLPNKSEEWEEAYQSYKGYIENNSSHPSERF